VPARPHTSLSENVATEIRDLILSGELHQHQQINIHRMATELETSITPVREALVALRGEGFVELLPNRGFRVARLDRRDIEDLYLVHSFVAGELAARACENMTDEQVDVLASLHAAMRESLVSHALDQMEERNREFHALIYLEARANKLAWLNRVIHLYIPSRFYARVDGWAESVMADHETIVAAFRARDPDAARRTMAEHIANGGTALVAHFDRTGFWADPTDVPGVASEQVVTG
jgi:DNA-binding GntR family transcriptional regulator